MPLKEFWHGDIKLFDCYQKSYLRNKSYEAWQQGQYNAVAFNIVMANAFAKKGSKPQEYPQWKDPVEIIKNANKPKITKENIETVFRQEQARQMGWLHNLLNK